MRELLDAGLARHRLRHQAGNGDELADQLLFRHLVHQPAQPCKTDGKAGEHGKLAGEGLGGSHANLRPGQCQGGDVTFARNGGGRHVDDSHQVLALLLGVAQGGQRIRRLARLRDNQRQPARLHRGLAIAELGGDINIHGHPGVTLEPVFAGQARQIAGATGRYGEAIEFGNVKTKLERQAHLLLGHVEVMRQCAGDHFRLLVNFLGHEVAVIALVDHMRAGQRPDFRARHLLIEGIVDLRAGPVEHDPIAVIEIGDGFGERSQGKGVRAQIHLVLAMAHRQGRTLAGTNQQVFLAIKQERQCKRSMQARQRGGDCLNRRLALIQRLRDEVGNGFRIRFGDKNMALGLQFLPQRTEILDNPVMHHRDAGAGMGVRVVFGRAAMGGPAGMADADMALQGVVVQPRRQIFQLALRPHPLQMAIFQRRNARRIIAAIFETLERIDNLFRDGILAQYTDNSTHYWALRGDSWSRVQVLDR